jgi:prepilin-type N-terminal cleavage/methylation domain-containing protein
MKRGFTLIELITSMSIFSIFMLIVFAETNWLSRASGTVGRGAGELCVATRFVEKFRDDVRQAGDASIRYSGRALQLHVGGFEILYYVSLEDRRAVRWNETTKEIEYGPCLQRMEYKVSGSSRGGTLVNATWACLAESHPQPLAPYVASEAPRVLVLDTALRSQSVGTKEQR